MILSTEEISLHNLEQLTLRWVEVINYSNLPCF